MGHWAWGIGHGALGMVDPKYCDYLTGVDR